MYKTTLTKLGLLGGIATFWVSCDNNMLPYYDEQAPGKIVIRGVVQEDSLQIVSNGSLLKINQHETLGGTISKDYEFVYYNGQARYMDVRVKTTQQLLGSYAFTQENSPDTLSFFYKPGLWINDVLSFSPGTISQSGRTGYKFIFPTLNRYSNSGYDGPIDGIIRNLSGQVLGVAQNITKETFSNFVEFPFAAPPILRMELVKHGTTESYRSNGQPVVVAMVMQNNKSRLVVLEEKQDAGGNFSGVQGTLDLCDFFQF
ncbi:hypothetical protein [Flavobacterium sp. CAU 1735]|uniref:hypothetical protein n=1 Tax=Flavobacterium sp. CAU 1735 TaxID=3140361 RepID=UPI003261AB5A